MSRSPTMVFAGSFWSGSSGSGLSAGFRALGWNVQEVDQRDAGIGSGKGLLGRAMGRLTRRKAEEAHRQRLLAECRALKPDIFLTIKGVGITGELLRQIKDNRARTAIYYPDVAFDHPGVFPESFGEYDLFVTSKTFQVDYLRKLLGTARVACVPHGYSASVHRPAFPSMSEADFRADVLHAGNHSAYKQKWMEDAAAALPEATFRIIGNRWKENAATGALQRCDMPGARLGVGYAEAIQTARINVAVHMGQTASGWEDKVSTRTFEIPACGGFMLHIDNDEVRDFFQPGSEIDVFSSPDELADKIRFYLPRPELRARMIEQARQRCVPAYSYGARARQIAGLLES